MKYFGSCVVILLWVWDILLNSLQSVDIGKSGNSTPSHSVICVTRHDRVE